VTTATMTWSPSGKWMVAAAGVVTAVALLWAAASAHLQRACTLRDTPYLPLCPPPPAQPADVQEQLMARISRNPGDSWAWVRLLVAKEGPERAAVLRGAAELAPNHAAVMRQRAVAALEGGRLPEAVALLVQMTADRHAPDAANLLAQIIPTQEGVALLRPHLAKARFWLPTAMHAMESLKLPPGAALPLFAEALEKGALPQQSVQAYMRVLKAKGDWLDAYGLWLLQHKQAVPLLYNGSFDHAFVPDGFDWEFTPVTRTRAGVIIQQHAVARRGSVLELEFTGRSFTKAIIRQHVFLAPGPYRLRGEYMASKLRSEAGLSWAVLCPSGPAAVAAQSSPMQDTGGAWKVIEFDFKVPADCGPMATLQLEPSAAYEAVAGIKGRLGLDGFGLTPWPN